MPAMRMGKIPLLMGTAIIVLMGIIIIQHMPGIVFNLLNYVNPDILALRMVLICML